MGSVSEYQRVKTFMASMDWFNLPAEEKKKFLKDKRLTLGEKKILECSTLLREGKFQDVLSTLEHLKVENILVESQRCIVLGATLNALSRPHEAIAYFSSAIKILKEHELPKYEFTAQAQVFFVHLNLKNKPFLASILDRMDEIIGEDAKDRITYQRCRFNYHMIIEDYAKALSDMNSLDKSKDQMHPSQQVFHLVDKFIYHLKVDQFQKCEMTLEELKKYRYHRSTEGFVFMQALLAHYMHRKPIYLYDHKFQAFPILFHQLKVIQYLESGNRPQAKDHWLKLHAINSEVYAEFMEYKGDKCLFSLCLGLYSEEQKVKEKKPLPDDLKPREKELFLILEAASAPVMKEELYLKLWGVPLEDKDDLFKLAMLVSRVKKKMGIEIKSVKGSYFIKDSKVA